LSEKKIFSIAPRLETGVLKKVLVVDDDPGITLMLQEALKQEEYSVEWLPTAVRLSHD